MRPPTLEQYCALIGAEPTEYSDWLTVAIEYMNLIAGISAAIHTVENEVKWAEIRKARGKRRILPTPDKKPAGDPLVRFWEDVIKITEHLAYDGTFKAASRRKGVAFISNPRDICFKLQEQFGWYWASIEKVKAAQKVKEGQIPDGNPNKKETA